MNRGPRDPRKTGLSGAGFRRVTTGRAEVRWSVPAVLSLLFAIAGAAFLVRALHHPELSTVPAAPLLAIALLCAAWNRSLHRP